MRRRSIINLIFSAIAIGSIMMSYASNYKIGPGDFISVQVLTESEFSGVFQVLQDGSIDFPYLKHIQVKGKTLSELDDLLTQSLKNGYLKDPQVIVQMKEFNSQRVTVLGSVVKPGRYVLTEQTKILDLLTLAGGMTPNGGKRVLLFRGLSNRNASDQSSVAVNQTESPLAANPNVSAQTQIAPLSSSQTPTSVVQQVPLNVVPIVVDYYGLVHEGKLDENISVQDGDVINVPTAHEIFVLGSVGKPGPIKFEERMTALQAIAQAGGVLDTAAASKIYVLRRGRKEDEKIPIDFKKILENKATNVTLEADDVMVVPESMW